MPIPNKESETVAKVIFEEWICQLGVMLKQITDRGKEFAKNVLYELCKLMNINRLIVTAYHPQANGQAERFNRHMKKYLTNNVSLCFIPKKPWKLPTT
jgi:IS30 family transposase